MTSPVVRITDLTKTYRQSDQQVTALEGVTLEMKRGEVVLLRGRSGSGKTTLLNVVAGWVEPDSGTIEWDGGGRGSERRWDQVAIVPQTLGLLEELNIDENVGLALRLGNVGSDDEAASVRSIMERLEIEHLAGRDVLESSLGEQQRAAVARALVVEPTLLLADEPSAHQDIDRLHLVWSQIREIATGGAAVLATGHDRDAERYCDRIVELRAGRLTLR
jgi:putative ABC transport system ATP-binding protein